MIFSGEEKRKHPRISKPGLRLELGGRLYSVVNWSMGGALVETDGHAPMVGTLVDVTGLGMADAGMVAVNIRARVQRIEDEGRRMAVSFFDIDTKAYELLQASE